MMKSRRFMAPPRVADILTDPLQGLATSFPMLFLLPPHRRRGRVIHRQPLQTQDLRQGLSHRGNARAGSTSIGGVHSRSCVGAASSVPDGGRGNSTSFEVRQWPLPNRGFNSIAQAVRSSSVSGRDPRYAVPQPQLSAHSSQPAARYGLARTSIPQARSRPIRCYKLH